MNDLQNQFYNIDDGFDRDAIQKEIDETFKAQAKNKEDLEKAKKELEDLKDEAHKSGTPPGWLE